MNVETEFPIEEKGPVELLSVFQKDDSAPNIPKADSPGLSGAETEEIPTKQAQSISKKSDLETLFENPGDPLPEGPSTPRNSPVTGESSSKDADPQAAEIAARRATLSQLEAALDATYMLEASGNDDTKSIGKPHIPITDGGESKEGTSTSLQESGRFRVVSVKPTSDKSGSPGKLYGL